MKKKIIALISSIALLLCGCTQQPFKSFKKIETSYPEWLEATSFENTKSGVLAYYNENPTSVEIGILCEKGVESYEDLCDMINAHNSFVNNNPDYFGNDIAISFIGTLKNWQNTIYFFNGTCKYLDMDYYKDNLEFEKTEKMQFALINIASIPDELFGMSSNFNVPIVILEETNGIIPSEHTYEVLKHFSNLEQVMISFNGDYNSKDIYDVIQKYTPGVRVFDAKTKEYISN